jgi:hypothetical protein
MHGMGWLLVLSGEVKAWLDGLDDEGFGRVACYLDLLGERGGTLPEPHSRRLGRNCRLRELVVPHGRRRGERLSYWLDGSGTVLVLTVGRWWRPRRWELARARAALRRHRRQGPRRRNSRGRGGACQASGEEPA